MPYIPPQVVQEVKRIDLLTYLKNYEPYELVHFSGNTYTTRTHDSLKISNGKWMWWSRGIGGRSALDYLIKVKDYSFLEAVELLAGQANIQPPLSVSEQLPVEKHLLLPKENRYHTNVFSYLTGRGIDNDIVRFCIETGRIYESAYHHNAVFVGMDQQGKPQYAALRGINTDFIGEANGSDKNYSFLIPAEKMSDKVHVFESAIDLLSYATMQKLDGKEWRTEHLLSLAGVYQPAKEIELVFAGYAEGNPDYDRSEDAFHAYCASYMLSKKYGMDISQFDFTHAPEFFENMEPQEVRGELSKARDAANAISGRMAKVLEQDKNLNQRQQGRAENGQKESEAKTGEQKTQEHDRGMAR